MNFDRFCFFLVLILSLYICQTNVIYNSVITVSNFRYSLNDWITLNDKIQRNYNYNKLSLTNYLIDSIILYLEFTNTRSNLKIENIKNEIFKMPIFEKNGLFNSQIFDIIIKHNNFKKDYFIHNIKNFTSIRQYLSYIFNSYLPIPILSYNLGCVYSKIYIIKILSLPFSCFNLTNHISFSYLKYIYTSNILPYNNNIFATYSVFCNSKVTPPLCSNFTDLFFKNSYSIYDKKKRAISFLKISINKKDNNNLVKNKKTPYFYIGKIKTDDFYNYISNYIFSLREKEISHPIKMKSNIYILKIEKIYNSRIARQKEIKNIINYELLRRYNIHYFIKSLSMLEHIFFYRNNGINFYFFIKNKKQRCFIKKNINDVIIEKTIIKSKYMRKYNLFPLTDSKWCLLKIIDKNKCNNFYYTPYKDKIKKIFYRDIIEYNINSLILLRKSINIMYKTLNNNREINYNISKYIEKILSIKHKFKINVKRSYFNYIMSNSMDNMSCFLENNKKRILITLVTNYYFNKTDFIKRYHICQKHILEMESQETIKKLIYNLRRKYKINVSNAIYKNL